MVEEVNNKGEIDLQMTRHILSHLRIKYPRGVTDVISVAAYQSETDFLTDFNFSMILPNFSYNPIQPAFSNMGLLLGQKILFPYDIDAEKALEKAINLARKDDFKKKRRGLYDWQEEVIRTGKPLEEALHKLNSLINDYNIHVKDECLKDRVVNFLEGFSYVVSPIAAELSKALVEGNPVAATEAGLLALGRITRKGEGVDKQEVITAEYAPAAMFHDISRILGWPIDRK